MIDTSNPLTLIGKSIRFQYQNPMREFIPGVQHGQVVAVVVHASDPIELGIQPEDQTEDYDFFSLSDISVLSLQ